MVDEGATTTTMQHGGIAYKVHVGAKGGKYIIVKGKRRYILRASEVPQKGRAKSSIGKSRKND